MLVSENPWIELKGPFLFINGKLANGEIISAKDMKDVLYKKPKSKKIVYTEYFLGESDGKRAYLLIIPGRTVASEFGRTKGWKAEEIYEVLNGKALFLLHEENSDGSINLYKVLAEKNDVVRTNGLPFVIYTLDNEPLVLACISKGDRDYSYFEKNHGPALFYTKEGVIQNTNYLISKTVEMQGEKSPYVRDFLRRLEYAYLQSSYKD